MNRKMKGISITSMLIVMALVIFFALLGVTLIPQYLEYYEIKDSLTVLAKDPNVANMSREKVKSSFLSKLQINNVHGMNADNLIIEKKDKQTYLSYKYERRVHMVGNIDVVLTFDDRMLVE